MKYRDEVYASKLNFGKIGWKWNENMLKVIII